MRAAILVRTETRDDELPCVISKPTTTIGRAGDCTLVLKDKSVSRQHAQIKKCADTHVVTDNDSRNGTSVNGIAIIRHVLKEGDHIRFGNVEVVFHEIDNAEEYIETSPEPMDADEDVAPSNVTSFLALPDLSEFRNLRAVNAWQIVRSFGSCVEGGELDLVRSVCEDLAGIRGVYRVVLYIRPGILGERANWIKAGAKQRRTGVCLPDEALVEVAATGIPHPKALHGPVPSLREACCRDTAVCVPVLIAGQPCASFCIEGDDELSTEIIDGVCAAADAVGLGLQMRSDNHHQDVTHKARPAAVGIVGGSSTIQRCVRLAMRAGKAASTILIRGESGVGKELFARLVYEESGRATKPFVPVHSSAIEETLLGSALFGHEKGAFTGAMGMKRGLFEEADGGTIFLDEIGELSLAMQVKLLRVLQEGEFMRLGGNALIHVDVRVIAATNRDLEQAVREGAFREDLYYRLKVIQLDIPPLRERREDIPDLVRHFLSDLSSSLQTSVSGVTEDAMNVLCMYDWPGNVRELRNVIERSLVLADGPEMTPDDLPAELVVYCDPTSSTSQEGAADDEMSLDAVDRRHIRNVLQDCGGNKKLAAQRLGISRSTLYEKLKS